MKEFGMKCVVWVSTASIAVVFVLAIIICIPIAIVGDMLNEKERRIKR